ncbi:hypothetical protein [Deinococcus radiotolerans]|uniref:Uncharacterized protein n=1 Tax=Deinococcus radiotolerans TaxID=1309407 RepID=A0ABQ2FQ74_9DEIO|nr:hypothetical protein [Deinococcus radiotolerans]GGL15902.1 hypothetical protein GCM10010844_38500 [Deinococcus radiotolerans]
MSEQTPQTTPARPDTFAGATRQQVQAWRNEYGEDAVKTLSIPLGGRPFQVILRKPGRLDYEKHTETLMKLREGKVAQAMSANRALVMTCTLAPDTATLAAALDQYPALADKLAEPALSMAGADAEVREETF